MKNYENYLINYVMRAYEVGNKARRKNYDPTPNVEIKLANNLGERVEGLLNIKGISKIIEEYKRKEKDQIKFIFNIVKDIANGKLVKGSVEKRVDFALRIGLAILTEGVLVAPTEGISSVKINEDNTISVFYAGPIRSSGGTVLALSVLLADIIREELGLKPFKFSDKEIDRVVEEVQLYERFVHLQYMPSEKDLRTILKNLNIDVNGDPTEDFEVETNRNIPRIPSNRVRGSVALVLCEGIAQKASKLFHYVEKYNISSWKWIKEIVKVKKEEKTTKIKPIDTYLKGAVAGRPIFAYPSSIGGFRLRYGRSFNNGLMAKNIHPATMILLDNFIAIGTHVKLERPGKGAVIFPNNKLEPPIVRLKNGDVIKVRTLEEAKLIKKDVEEILFLGDILVNYGDFRKSGHVLLPPGYCEEWWLLEAKQKNISEIPKNVKDMIRIANKGVPLHPDYIFFWNNISKNDLFYLVKWLKTGLKTNEFFVLKQDVIGKKILENIGLEHRVSNNEILITLTNYEKLMLNLGDLDILLSSKKDQVLDILNESSTYVIRDKVGTYIGMRMGRPEKADIRAMEGKPNVLFPTGRTLRSLTKLYDLLESREKQPYVNLELALYKCPKCGRRTFYKKCPVCETDTVELNVCSVCGRETVEKKHCNKETKRYKVQHVNFIKLYRSIREKLNYSPVNLKGVQGMFSKEKIPERLEKGFLREKYNIYVFRDGTARFDSTDAPLTHFRPKDIGVSVERLKSLGYKTDYMGNMLERDDQIVALKKQDIIISYNAAEYLINVAKFVDDELVYIYQLEPFYNVKTKEDLIGHLVIGLAPHISTGVIGRIIGFTPANVLYAHPYFHTAKRRNCDGDEDGIMLLLDAFINFSTKYLSTSRGSTMDAPLVLTNIINPKEVDDEVYEMETVFSYPLDLYEKAQKFAQPYDVDIDIIKNHLDEENQTFGFTLDNGDLNNGPLRTRYVLLKSIPEKIEAEIEVMKKIRAVQFRDALEKIIVSHFIPDMYGNLRKFSKQSFRCIKCNEKYRRIPLIGRCVKCGGNLVLTIHKGGIEKYVNLSIDLANKYKLSDYLIQRLNLIRQEIDSVFFNENKKDVLLTDFFNQDSA